MSKIMITGASGFIGSHIAEYFCMKGESVTCLVREGSDLSNLSHLPVKLVRGDVTNASLLTSAFEGFDTVIHNAGLARDWGKYETFYKTNVEGTLNVLNACYQSGVKNIIMTGSNSIFGEENNNIVKDENSPHNSHYKYFADKIFPCGLNFYRDTKKLAADRASDFALSKNLNLTILNPVWVYGEREFNTGFYEYLKTAKSGIPFLPGAKTNRFHVVYVKDLARAFFLAYEKKLPGVNSIIVGNSEAALMNDIYTIFCNEAGFKKPKNMPKSLVYPAAFFLELAYTLLRAKKPPLLTRGRVNMFYDNIEYSTNKANELLGFTNDYSLEQGIKQTVAWYKDSKLI